MRERIEDLGRLSEILDCILGHDVFRHVLLKYNSSNEFCEKYSDPEQLEALEISIQDLYHRLSECWVLARWGDKG